MDTLLFQAFVYLCAAVIAVPIAKRLGLGSVLGYLIAGIVIGPILHLVGAETQEIQHVAEFGVVMMLFLVGLELQPQMLWAMRHRLLGLGGLQVLLTLLLAAGGAMALGVDWRTALAVGMIFAMSSTAIVLQTLNEKGLTKTEGGRASFSVLLFQDIAVIPMLAIIPLLALPELVSPSVEQIAAADAQVLSAEVHEVAQHTADAHGHDMHDNTHETHDAGHGEHHESMSLIAGLPSWAQALVVLGAVAAVLLGGHFLAHPLFRYIASARLREIFTASALLLVVGIALLMTVVGLSPALGTFLAGVVLANSEFRHELESDIEPFKGLLLGLFFITVGAGINFGVLFSDFALVLGLTLGVMTLKAAVLFGLARLFRLAPADNWLFTLSLAQAGEFGFVLLNFALQKSVMSSELFQTLSLVVALSMLLTPALFILYDKLVLPRIQRTDEAEADSIDEQGTVIIAGVGRFGQVVNRFLHGSGVQTVILDHEANMIEVLRKLGVKSYYGDASRPDLLHAAGIEHAQILVVAIDDRERAVTMVEHVRRHYPQVKIMARAFDLNHLYLLKNAGADIVVRELFESSVVLGKEALKHLGVHPFKVEKMAQTYHQHDLAGVENLFHLWDEDSHLSCNRAFLTGVKEHRATLQDALAVDRIQLHDRSERGWTPPPKGYTKAYGEQIES